MTNSDARPTVAVVEDDFVLRETICAALRDSGFEPHAAATLPNARKILGLVRPDVVVLDLALGDEDGRTLLDELQRGGERTAPIVISARREAQALAQEGVPVLMKPFPLERLLDLVARLARRG